MRTSIGADVLDIGSTDGSVSAFDATGCGTATCPPRRTGTTPAEITGSPAISGVPSSARATARVTAFGLPGAER